MKKLGAAVLTIFLLLGTGTAVFAKTTKTSTSGASAGEFEVDGSLGFATGPESFNSGFGVNFGAGYMLSTIDKHLQARVDLSYYDFSYDYGYGTGYNLNYTRVPITFSARYYFPIQDRLRAFAQAGLETSFDSFDHVDGGVKRSKSEVNLGLTPGGGIEFFVSPKTSIFAVGLIHMISDDYFSMQFGAAFHF